MIFEFNVLWLQNFLSIFESLSRMLLMQKISERNSSYKDLQTLWFLGLLQNLSPPLIFLKKYIIFNSWTDFNEIGHSLCLPLLLASTDRLLKNFYSLLFFQRNTSFLILGLILTKLATVYACRFYGLQRTVAVHAL